MKKSRDLSRLLDPCSIAVIGATDTEGRPGRIVFEMLLPSGRILYPVNPNKQQILGQKAFASVNELPPDIDVAIITVAARAAVESAEMCALHGIPYIIILAGGFSEASDEGRVMEALGLASNTGFGMYAFVGLGNKCDLNELDFLRHFGQDPRVTCWSFYLESLDAGREFLEEARRVSHDKPVVVLKAGRSAAAVSAASSHTGRLAGSSLVACGAFRQYGILSVMDDEELCDASKTLARLPPARGNRVALITPAGGYGVMCADYIEGQAGPTRLAMAVLQQSTVDRIRSFALPFASCRNPVDLTASANDAMFCQSIDALLEDPGVDILICIAFLAPPEISDALIDGIARRAAASTKPILVFTQYGPFTDNYLRRFYQVGVIGFPSIRRTVRAADLLVERAEILEALDCQPPARGEPR